MSRLDSASTAQSQEQAQCGRRQQRHFAQVDDDSAESRLDEPLAQRILQ
jgi:hypothetical protein